MNEKRIFGARAISQPSEHDPLRKACRILVVDDEPLIRQLHSEALMDADYEVEMTADGADAWNHLQRNRYDLLITDHEMPGLTGMELLKQLRVSGMTLPVIMATGTVPFAEFCRHRWLQPVVTLRKPYGLLELVDAVKVVLLAVNGGCGDLKLRSCREFDLKGPTLRS